MATADYKAIWGFRVQGFGRECGVGEVQVATGGSQFFFGLVHVFGFLKNPKP